MTRACLLIDEDVLLWRKGCAARATRGVPLERRGCAAPRRSHSKRKSPLTHSSQQREQRLQSSRDLNNIPPIQTLISGLSTTFFGVFLYNNILNGLLQPLNNAWNYNGDLYIISRVSGVGKTIFFGGFSLLTFFTIFVGLGVTVLGVRVSFGVLTGGEKRRGV